MIGAQVWVALGDNLAGVGQDLQNYGVDPERQGGLTAAFVAWNIVSAVLGGSLVLNILVTEQTRSQILSVDRPFDLESLCFLLAIEYVR